MGLCCFFWLPMGDHLVYSRMHCPFLTKGRTCGRWETRDEVPWCGKSTDVPRPLHPPTCVPHFDETLMPRAISFSRFCQLQGTIPDEGRRVWVDEMVIVYLHQEYPEAIHLFDKEKMRG